MADLTHELSNQAARLLIVDDEPNIRSAIGRALRLLGHDVTEASSGEEALLMLERLPYNLMVLDMRMPGLDGIEVMRRAHELYPNLLIVILTGHATLESAIAAVKSEAVDYLLKPASVQQIADTVTRSLQKHAGESRRQHLVQLMGEALEALRQTEPPLVAPPVSKTKSEQLLHFYPLTLDRGKRLLSLMGDQVDTIQLTEGEAVIMASLMMAPDQILSCHDLIQVGWNYEMNEREAQGVVRPHICRLRRKLGVIMPKLPLIRTVRKRGYMLQTSKK
jgi:DNA-binding response OmpR family regulator